MKYDSHFVTVNNTVLRFAGSARYRVLSNESFFLIFFVDLGDANVRMALES